MTIQKAPRPVLWPFLIGDLLLLSLAGYFVFQSTENLKPLGLAVLFGCVATGALLSVLPFLSQHRAAVRLAESEALASAVTQMQHLEQIQDRISAATGQWDTIQQLAETTVGEAKQVAEKMKAEAQEFLKFLEKADQAEKTHLRLEVEKLRRSEGDWLQVLVHIFDHTFALHQAALNGKNQAVAGQIDQFQQACRMAGRRIGLVPFAPDCGELFEEKLHQLLEKDGAPGKGSRIAQTLACGYTYQGQLLRRALVAVSHSGDGSAAPGAVSLAEAIASDSSSAQAAHSFRSSPDTHPNFAPDIPS